MTPQILEAGTRGKVADQRSGSCCDQAQHQRQEEDAEMRGGMVAGQVKKVDHHQQPGRQQQPIPIARQRRAGRNPIAEL